MLHHAPSSVGATTGSGRRASARPTRQSLVPLRPCVQPTSSHSRHAAEVRCKGAAHSHTHLTSGKAAEEHVRGSPLPATAVLEAPVKSAAPQAAPKQTQDGEYSEAERALVQLLAANDLDRQLLQRDAAIIAAAEKLNSAIGRALASAFEDGTEASSSGSAEQVEAAHTFLQRVLYRINRLKYFWFTDLQQYDNEDSAHLAAVRRRIEAVWYDWEARQVEGYDAIRSMNVEQVKDELKRRGAADVNPPPSPAQLYIRERMGRIGYGCLLATVSLDGLTEAARQSRTLATVGHDITMANFKVMMEEYGGGRLAKKHSTFFTGMMRELDLNVQPEAYLDIVPWQLLASTNFNFMLTNRRRTYLQYMGGLTYFEISGPAAYREYAAAARRIGLSASAYEYWELHMREDGERHGPWMLNDIALKLADMYPDQAWEVLMGYVQEQQMGARAGDAILKRIEAADNNGKF